MHETKLSAHPDGKTVTVMTCYVNFQLLNNFYRVLHGNYRTGSAFDFV